MSKGRVQFTPPSYSSQSLSWAELVDQPFHQGRIVEAFGSADALIDNAIEACLRGVYSDFKCQDLINEIHMQRNQIGFEGTAILEILKSKTVIDDAFVNKVRQFKKARNLVLHNTEGEYALVIGNASQKYSTQDELDSKVEEESKRWLDLAFEIVIDFYRINSEIKSEYYFSNDFYQKNPRGKLAQKKYPVTPSK